MLYNDKEVLLKENLLDFVHPVGSLYWSSNNTDPGTLFGGTWQQIKDRFVLAAGDSYSNGATGGEKTHTLTAGEMPIHGHEFSATTTGTGKHSHSIQIGAISFGAGGNGSSIQSNNEGAMRYFDFSKGYTNTQTGDHSHTISGSTYSSGFGTAHNNMPPYIVKYCWERMA